jgi:hypothetical protein
MWNVLETIGSPCVIGEESLLCEGMSKGEEEDDEDDENESDDEGLSGIQQACQEDSRLSKGQQACQEDSRLSE